jgi:hypothetical protein
MAPLSQASQELLKKSETAVVLNRISTLLLFKLPDDLVYLISLRLGLFLLLAVPNFLLRKTK